ncbi:MAG: TIGR03435 family protein [Janthinobacterium lividum]
MASFILPLVSVCGTARPQVKTGDIPAVASERIAPVYDVVSVKPHKPGNNSSMVSWTSTTYMAENVSVKNLVATAYDVKMWSVFGLPSWAEKTTWDIQAKVSDPVSQTLGRPSPEYERAMVHQLLRDRFGLEAHSESKIEPIYEMTVLPEGAKFHQSPPLPPTQDGEKPKPSGGVWSIGNGVLEAKRMSMDMLTRNLAYQVEKVIIDQTNLPGVYDLELKWTPEIRVTADNGSAADLPPAIFTAVREQLGLKLSPAKAPVPTVVVDRIKQPEED